MSHWLQLPKKIRAPRGTRRRNTPKNSLLLGLCDFADHLVRCSRLIYAERLFREEVSRSRVGAGAASHANVAKFTAAALPFQVVVVAQLAENDRVGPDLGGALLAQIAGDRGQVTAGENFSLVRDEAHTGSSEAALGHGVHIAGMASRMTRVSNRRTTARLERNSRRARHGHLSGADVSRRVM